MRWCKPVGSDRPILQEAIDFGENELPPNAFEILSDEEDRFALPGLNQAVVPLQVLALSSHAEYSLMLDLRPYDHLKASHLTLWIWHRGAQWRFRPATSLSRSTIGMVSCKWIRIRQSCWTWASATARPSSWITRSSTPSSCLSSYEFSFQYYS